MKHIFFDDQGRIDPVLGEEILKIMSEQKLLQEIFPESGLSLSSRNCVYQIYSSKAGSINKYFSGFSFTNKVVSLNKLYEKEYLTLTKPEYEKILEFIQNVKIIE